MRCSSGMILIFAGVLLCEGMSALGQATLPADFAPARPSIPDRTFKLSDFGGVGDGASMNTGAFEKAVSACKAAGGGTLDVGPGEYLTGPFELTSNLDLHLEKGATIRFSGDVDNFPMEHGAYRSCISVMDGHDISITGQGTIDGHGEEFWHHFELARETFPERPRLVELYRCSRVLVADVTLTNSPMFHLVPSLCQDVTIENVHIKAPAISPNTDGVDPSGVNFLITGCTIDTGDDCIALKAGARFDEDHRSCENFLITNCRFLHGHGMSIGSESYGGVKNVMVSHCTFEDTEVGIRLKSPRGRGGLVEDLTYEHLTMRNVKNAIYITSYYPKVPAHPERDAAEPVDSRTPQWRHISITDVKSTNGYSVGEIVGLPEMPVEDLVFTDVQISAERPIEIANAKSVRFVDCNISSMSGKPIILGATVEGLE